ncbi:MAG: hypothetical protein ACRDZ3_20875 [Acidimicrobiia bacterium]
MTQELSFWGAVALVAVAAIALFKILAAKVGDRVPALAELAAFI